MVKRPKPNGVSGDLSLLTDDERRALRGSKFAPLPSNLLPSSSHQQPPPPPPPPQQPRMAHPGGQMTTNKAAALAKFLERKLQQPGGLESMKPELLELAVKNAKEAVNAGGSSGKIVRHVASFDDSEDSEEAARSDPDLVSGKKKKKPKPGNLPEKSKAKKKKRRKMEGSEHSKSKKHKKNKR